VYVTSCADQDYKDEYNTNFDEYNASLGNCILLCVNRHREGSDIPYLDCGLYLDAVKIRSILVSLQTAGRIIRIDPFGLKTRGIVVDLFVSDGEKKGGLLTVQKIIGYYREIAHLEVNEDSMNQYRQLLELFDNTEFDEKEQLIKIKIDDDRRHDIQLKIKLIHKEDDWQNIRDAMRRKIIREAKISKEEEFNHIIDIIKKANIFSKNSDFWLEYSNIKNKGELGLPNDLYNEFKEFFDTKSWYDILGIDTKDWLQTPKAIKEFFKNKNIVDVTESRYRVYAKIFKQLPPNPKEFFKFNNFTTIEKEFSVKNMRQYIK